MEPATAYAGAGFPSFASKPGAVAYTKITKDSITK